ncbi:hypothetical protein, partial [Nonomuraea antimicrobica]|uniref:hypothetical protein n=1 Tax=Nonomuraea antimicrobica TaxID=561173 RepID=UPI0031F03191
MTAAESGHGCADPRLCMDCRRQRLQGRPMPGQDALEVVGAPTPGQVVELAGFDQARLIDQDLQRLVGQLGYVAFTFEDAVALYRAATRHRIAGWLAPDVSVRVAEAMSEALAADPALPLDL